jgi:hypothetical protein
VQYSGPLAPSTAGDVAVAPEMMELLGRIIPTGEGIEGLGRIDEATVILTRNGMYLVSGDGPDAIGANDDMSRTIEVPADAGCIEARSVANFDNGVMYRSPRCFYTLGRDHQLLDVGNPVEVRALSDAYPTTTSAVVVPEYQHIRFTVTTTAGGSGRILVYDYGGGNWFEWNVLSNGGSATAFVGGVYSGGVYYVTDSTGQVWQESALYVDDTTQFVEMDIWSGWVQPAGPMSWHRFGMVSPLGERRDAAKLNLRIYTDYDDTAAAADITWTEAEIAALPKPTKRLGDLQRVPQVQQGQAMSFRFTDAVGSVPGSQGFAFAGLGMDVTVMGGAPKTTRVGQT